MVIPQSLRGEMLERAHDKHLGIVKTKARVREVIWWSGMNNQVEQLVSSCESLRRVLDSRTSSVKSLCCPLICHSVLGRKWQRIYLSWRATITYY